MRIAHDAQTFPAGPGIAALGSSGRWCRPLGGDVACRRLLAVQPRRDLRERQDRPSLELADLVDAAADRREDLPIGVLERHVLPGARSLSESGVIRGLHDMKPLVSGQERPLPARSRQRYRAGSLRGRARRTVLS